MQDFWIYGCMILCIELYDIILRGQLREMIVHFVHYCGPGNAPRTFQVMRFSYDTMEERMVRECRRVYCR